ncbi:hypothetical protein DSL72_006458 [Monilinia vaccinii-corymbosi]|uniref:Uncharacterized protein n=1 Tax=Monilinia vaccinii-corymbosi TaxID=61207 RepID=A0A8A3PMG7_9HELO|nr:hypothetical protein DSL72_006458 [Monilinia vaccinii-corymbosi]
MLRREIVLDTEFQSVFNDTFSLTSVAYKANLCYLYSYVYEDPVRTANPREGSSQSSDAMRQSPRDPRCFPYMNINSNLSIYIQLMTFRKGSAEKISIDVPDDSQVETARCLSRRLNFRFRYSYDTRKAIITRDSSFRSLGLPDLNDFESDMQGLFYHEYTNIRDANTDVEISSYQDFATPLPEFSGDFGLSAHNIGFSDELFSDASLNLDDATFDNLISDFQSEQIGGDMPPDWSDLVDIADHHDNPDTDMPDSTRLEESGFGDILEACDTTQLEIRAPATVRSHNPITDIPAWRNISPGPVAVLDVPTPRPLSRADSFQSMPSDNPQSKGMNIAIKPSLTRSEYSLSNTPSSYQEGVFSSAPGSSSVPTTYGSSPRRMGPLDSVTRAKANAVKAIGACWRCKFLRKPCDAQKCCSQCEGKQGGPWHSIGCKRGDIKNRMLLVSLCPKKTVASSRSSTMSDMDRPWLYANHHLLEIFQQREKDLLPSIMNTPNPTKVDTFLQNFKTGEPLLVGLQQTRLPLMERLKKTTRAVLKPLDDCILAILWGLLECECALKAIHPWMSLHNGTLRDFIILLNSAALYQASVGSNQLIAYSLACLRTCIEALHANASGGLQGAHEACEASLCLVDCTRNIELQLAQYLDELSRVIFLKVNMRTRIWWLSTFYSLCIQGVIRQTLISLSCNDQGEMSHTEKLRSTQYLHIAVRLFTASSGNHDPLIRDWSSESALASLEDGAPRIEDYQDAQLAVKQADWRRGGITKSGSYLKNLFDDHGGILPETDGESANPQL